MSRVVVIGAGVAGLTAALKLARAGVGVTLVSKGVGGLQLSQGTVDVLGYAPDRVTSPFAAVEALVASDPKHPYAVIGTAAVREGLELIREVLGGDLLAGDLDTNYQLPTAVGAIRPTCLAQPSMVAGACVDGARFAIVGLRRLKDFHPALVAGNLARTPLPGGGRLQARALVVDLPARAGEADSSGLTYARAFDDPAFRTRFAAELKPLLIQGESVGLPAVLGLKDRGAWRDLEQKLGYPVFEIPLPPPAVPGMRLNDALTAAAQAAGVRFIRGSRVQATRTQDGRVAAVTVGTSGRAEKFAADAFVHAAGGFESGALSLDSYGVVSETLFGLPLADPAGPGTLVHGDDGSSPRSSRPSIGSEERAGSLPALLNRVWGAEQPLFAVGVGTDPSLRPVGTDGEVVYQNLYAAGGILAGAYRWREKSGEGIALGSAVKAAAAILEALS